MNETKQYDWIILFLFFISIIIRFFMWKSNSVHIDFFIAIVNLIGLDYTATSIIYSINNLVENKIHKHDFATIEKNNKIKRHKRILHICILILCFYNIIHFFLFSCSLGNDVLSMMVLGISLTDDSIVKYISEKIRL